MSSGRQISSGPSTCSLAQLPMGTGLDHSSMQWLAPGDASYRELCPDLPPLPQPHSNCCTGQACFFLSSLGASNEIIGELFFKDDYNIGLSVTAEPSPTATVCDSLL